MWYNAFTVIRWSRLHWQCVGNWNKTIVTTWHIFLSVIKQSIIDDELCWEWRWSDRANSIFIKLRSGPKKQKKKKKSTPNVIRFNCYFVSFFLSLISSSMWSAWKCYFGLSVRNELNKNNWQFPEPKRFFIQIQWTKWTDLQMQQNYLISHFFGKLMMFINVHSMLYVVISTL